MILTVIFIVGDTFCFCIWLHHGLVFISADLLVLGVADLVLDKLTFFSGGVLTQSLTLHLADLLVDGVTSLEGLLLVFCVIDHNIFNTTLDRTCVMMQRLHKLLRFWALDLWRSVGCSRDSCHK